jgi:hypothetical protein
MQRWRSRPPILDCLDLQGMYNLPNVERRRLEYGEELTPETFKTELGRLQGILHEKNAQNEEKKDKEK